MKKTVSFVLAVLMLASMFAVAAYATPAKASVTTELAGLCIDGKQFNEADYPIDKNRDDIEVLAVAEKGFRTLTSSPDYGLYIYIYNPSCVVFSDSGSLNIGINLDSESYSTYSLKLMSKSEDFRFYKYQVKGYYGNALSNLYKLQKNQGERVYTISLLNLSGEKTNIYSVGKTCVFTGFDFENNKGVVKTLVEKITNL